MDPRTTIPGTNAWRDGPFPLYLETAFGGKMLIIGTAPCSASNPARYIDNTNLDGAAVDQLIGFLVTWRATHPEA